MKDQILENYLNTIYYGRGAYGIQTASKAYFNKDVSQLTVAEGASLAAVINAPSLYDPGSGANQQANLKTRVNYVLDGMVTEGWLTPDDRDKVTGPAETCEVHREQATPARTVTSSTRSRRSWGARSSSRTPTSTAAACGSHDDQQGRPGRRGEGGQEVLPKDAAGRSRPDSRIKPGDGAIVAIYGGADFQKEQLNSATDAMLQAGSTFKPFALIAALSKDGISTKTEFSGASPAVLQGVRGLGRGRERQVRPVKNFNQQSFGKIDLRRATANSVNTVFASSTTRSARRTPRRRPGGRPPGEGSRRPTHQRPRHRVPADRHRQRVCHDRRQGQRATPYLVRRSPRTPTSTTRASRPDGRLRQGRHGRHHRRPPRSSAGNRPVRPGLGRPIAGKTGTTTDNKSAWFTGSCRSWSPRSACTATSTAPPVDEQLPGLGRGQGRQPPGCDLDGLHEGGHRAWRSDVPQAGRHG